MKYPVSFEEMIEVENYLFENPTYMEIKKQLRIQSDILKEIAQKYPNSSYEEFSDEDRKIFEKAKKEESRLFSKKSEIEKNEHERREGIREKYGMLGLQDGNELKGRLNNFISDMVFMQARSPEAKKEARSIISLVMPNLNFDEFSDTWINADLNGILDKICEGVDIKTVTFESIVDKINEELRNKENEKKASKESIEEYDYNNEPIVDADDKKVADEETTKTVDVERVDQTDKISNLVGKPINIVDVISAKNDKELNEELQEETKVVSNVDVGDKKDKISNVIGNTIDISEAISAKNDNKLNENAQTENLSNAPLARSESTWMSRFQNWHKTMLDKLPQKVQDVLKTISESVKGRNKQNEVEQNEVRKNDDGER